MCLNVFTSLLVFKNVRTISDSSKTPSGGKTSDVIEINYHLLLFSPVTSVIKRKNTELLHMNEDLQSKWGDYAKIQGLCA